jgi:CheY-like chemotaxis protein
MSLQPDSEVGQYVTAICQASNRAANLVKQILTFSRMGNQEEQEIQVTPIVREAMKLMRASIPTTVDIRMNVLANPVVLADPTEIHRILVNLCTNASLAMRDREGTLEVRLDEVDLDADFAAAHPEISPGRFMRLTVRDTGCGMSPEVASRIFDPFFTTRGEGEGTGMGLSVVHGIVRKRHGLILVESEPDRGTSFEVLLPMVEEGEEGRIDLLGAPLTGTGRILFVDDEPLVADTAERMLRALGYTVSAFTASLEALAEFRRKPDAFDLVITDVTMPGLTGDALAARIREIRPGIPVVLCTGHTDRITAEKAKELGFDGFLLKPVVLGDLSRTVYRLLVRW